MRRSDDRWNTGNGPSRTGPIPRVVLVDADRSYRRWLRSLITPVDIDVVGESDDGTTAASLTRSFAPDVVVIALDLESADGLEAAQGIRHQDPEVHIVALATFDGAAWHAESRAGLYLYAMMPKEGLVESMFVLTIRRAWAQRLREDADGRVPTAFPRQASTDPLSSLRRYR